MKFSETTTKTVSRFLSLGVKVSIKWILLSWTHDDKRQILISLFIF
jgi:hypothetical protein